MAFISVVVRRVILPAILEIPIQVFETSAVGSFQGCNRFIECTPCLWAQLKCENEEWLLRWRVSFCAFERGALSVTCPRQFGQKTRDSFMSRMKRNEMCTNQVLKTLWSTFSVCLFFLFFFFMVACWPRFKMTAVAVLLSKACIEVEKSYCWFPDFNGSSFIKMISSLCNCLSWKITWASAVEELEVWVLFWKTLPLFWWIICLFVYYLLCFISCYDFLWKAILCLPSDSEG